MRTFTALSLCFALAAPALADTSASDPIPDHAITLEQAEKGLKGAGPLEAKLEIEQGGKPLGTFTCALFSDQTPKTVANFVGLARGIRPFKDPKTGQWVKRPFYDGLTFHRVIPEFMIQGGDPAGNGRGDPGYSFPDEIVDSIKMDKPGLLAMANRGPNTNGSQFFITEKAAPWLNGHFSIFGSCEPVSLEEQIARVPRGAGDRPTEPVVIKKVTISHAHTHGAHKKK